MLNGHEFEITMSVEADVPAVWECPRCGAEALSTSGILPEAKAEKPARTHWDMLLERRSEKELEDILKERLELLRGGEIGPAHLHPREAPQRSAYRERLTVGRRPRIDATRRRPRPRTDRSPGSAGPRAIPGRVPWRTSEATPPASRLLTTRVSSRRATGRVNGRISRMPEGVGDEARAEHQRAADQDQRAVGELLAGIWPLLSAVFRACQARLPSCRISQVPKMLSSDQQQDRPPGPDHLADLDEHVDLDQRHDDERERRAARPQPRAASRSWHGPSRRLLPAEPAP